MLILAPVMYRKRRKWKSEPTAAPAPTPVAPTLVSADFADDAGGSIVLHFDRAIAVSSFSGSAITVISIADDATYHGTGTPTVSGARLTVGLQSIGGSTGTQSVLNATGASGIVGASGGAAWAGVTNFVLDDE